MRRIVLVTVVLMAALALVACAAAGPAAPSTEPQIRGVITSKSVGETGIVSIRVVWTEDPAIGAVADFDAAQMSLTDTTVVLRKNGDSYTTIAATDLEVADIVYGWITGPVLESYPVQTGADTVVVVGRYTGTLPIPRGLEPEPVPAQ